LSKAELIRYLIMSLILHSDYNQEKAMNITRLEIKINFKRNRMIRSGIKKGLNHPDTIRLSQQLDKLLNEYQKGKFYRSIHHIAYLQCLG